MNNRLKQFLAAENITQSQFADKIEVVRASVSHVLSGRNNPSYEFIKAIIANYPSLNIEWLMFGKGKMYKGGTEDTSLKTIQKDTDRENNNVEYHEDLLFNDDFQDDTVQEVDETPPSSSIEPQVPLSFLKSLADSTKVSAAQRKVSKIIVLCDDGSYQEL